MYVCIYIYIHIHTCIQYMHTRQFTAPACGKAVTANLRTSTTILDFRGFDSSEILILRSGILAPIGDFPESLSQAILVGIVLVGRLCVDEAVLSER